MAVLFLQLHIRLLSGIKLYLLTYLLIFTYRTSVCVSAWLLGQR